MNVLNSLYNKYILPRQNAHIIHQANIKSSTAIHKIKAQLGYSGYSGTINQTMAGGAKFVGGLSNSGFRLSHFLARQNARTAYQETNQAKAVVDRLSDVVADTGLVLEATPMFSLLGITADAAEKWARDVEQRFDLFCNDKKQHRAHNMTMYQAHRLYQIFQHRDGDIFVRLYYSKDRNLQNPLQFEFLDPDQIRGDTVTTSYGFQNKHDGIERDSQGREKSYKIYVHNQDNTVKPVDIPRVGPKSGRIMMLHGFVPEYAGQGRGFSRLAHALQEFQNITDFTSAQIQKAINNSMFSMYVKPSPDNPASNILEGGGSGPIIAEYGADATPSDDAINVNPVGYQEIPEAVFRKAGSIGVFNLREGEDLKEFGQSAPSDSFDSFLGSFVSHLSASFSIPMEVLLMKFNSNYSASRASLIMFWRVAQIWRNEMKADFIDPIYEMWLSGEIAAGRISAPGWLNPVMRRAWLDNNLIGAPMPNIDPMRTAKASQTYVEMGLTTLKREAVNLNGSNAKANRKTITQEFSEIPESPFGKSGNNNGGNK